MPEREPNAYPAAVASVLAGIPAVLLTPMQFFAFIGAPLGLLAGVLGLFGLRRVERGSLGEILAFSGLILAVIALVEFGWLLWVCRDGC